LVINNSRFDPEDTFTANLNITITSPLIDDSFDTGEFKLVSHLNFERFFNQSGRHGTRVQRGVATSLTPTGFPINSESSKRRNDYTPLTLVLETAIQPAFRSGNTLNIQLTLSGILPSALPNGYYRPTLYLLLGSDEEQFPLPQNPYLGVDEGFENRAELGFEENKFATYLPMIQIGDTDAPRLPWALLLNTFSNGERGTIAREERELVGISTRHAFQGGRLVVPPHSSFDQAISYRLEPFVPTLSSSLASDVEPYPPIIPLKYSGGQLHTTVTMPDGPIIFSIKSKPVRMWQKVLFSARNLSVRTLSMQII